MKFLFRISILFILSLWGISCVFWATVYVPAPHIFMTGTTDDVRFDVADPIYTESATISKPYLDTATLEFHGGFYIPWYGWVNLSDGSYQVSLDCGWVSISSLSASCQLTGNAWWETVWAVDFSDVDYNPTTWMLEWTLHSNVWDLDIGGIFLPLKPAILSTSLDNSLAKHDHNLSVVSAASYGEGGDWNVWNLKLEPQKAYTPFVNVVWDLLGNFSAVDLSLADTYTITITDPSGSKTTTTARILPGPLSFTLTPGSFAIGIFCTANPTLCPDGATLRPTEFVKTGDNIVADGQSKYEFLLRSRDQYGNRINKWSVSISYKTTVQTIQVWDDWLSLLPSWFVTSFPGGAVIVDGDLTNYLDGTSSMTDVDLVWQDISYSISSIAPTDAGNIVQLESIVYKTEDGTIIPIPGADSTPLTFVPWFRATTHTDIPEIQVGEDHAFQVDVTDNSSRTDTTPQILSFFMVWDGAFAAFRDFTYAGSIDCQAYTQESTLYTWNCDWRELESFIDPTVVSIETKSDFEIRGSYAPMTRYPIPERVLWKTLVHYRGIDVTGDTTDVLYKTDSKDYGNSVYRDSRLKILGNTNAQGEYGTLSFEWNGKAKFFDTTRKNIALLERNRTDYSTVPYLIVRGDYTIGDWAFDEKRSIIVLGWDITIAKNIPKRDSPLVIIALSDEWWDGGIVTIAEDVTDINASIITDRHVTSSGDHQLYILGSIISSNTLWDTAAHICPYYGTSACGTAEAMTYDLENIRKWYTELADKTGKSALNHRALEYPSTSLIMESDPRITRNPPPGL